MFQFNSSQRREIVATFTLVTFLLSQWVMPIGLSTHSGSGVRIAEAQEVADQPDSPSTINSTNGATTPLSEEQGSACLDCNVSVKALDLSRVPSESELKAAGGFGGALSPIGSADVVYWSQKLDQDLQAQGFSTRSALDVTVARKIKADKIERLQKINLSFGQAMQEWNKHNYRQAAGMLAAHMKEYPDSPWGGEAALHLGCDAKYNGRYNEAYEIFDQMLSSTDDSAGSINREIHIKTRLRMADLLMGVGDFGASKSELSEILKSDNDWRRRTWARHWLRNLNQYESSQRNLRACGPRALAVMLAGLGQTKIAARVEKILPTRDEGFSLAELATLSSKNGVPLRGFRTQPAQLANLPLPLIVHYDYNLSSPKPPVLPATSFSGFAGKSKTASPKTLKSRPAKTGHDHDSGHFLVVEKVNAPQKLVHLFDPQARRHYRLTYAQLEREWSGTGLVQVAKAVGKPASATAKAQTRVAALSFEEMRHIVGGCCGVPSPPVDMGQPEGEGAKKSGCSEYGSPVWSVEPINLNLFITDVPIWYETPAGPDVEIRLSYNSQDATSQNNVFGNKWVFNYGSYVVEDTAVGGGVVSVFMPDGRQDNFVPNGSGGFTRPSGNYNTLRKIGNSSYSLTFPSGEQFIYAIPAGTNSLQPFLTESRDRWGYKLRFGYDSNVRLTTITDAQNKVTTLTYNGDGQITRVTEPARAGFAQRFATFGYSANGNLVSVTDMAGKAFQYTYDSDVRVTKLNTPTGPYTFFYEEPDGINNASDPFPRPLATMWENSRLTITDPMGFKEQYNYNGYSKYSWYVDKNNYVEYTATLNNYSDSVSKTKYVIGTISDGKGKITKVVNPDGGSNWLQYDSQSGRVTGTSDSDERYSYLTYNAQGQVTSVTDRKEAVTKIGYAANGLDVVSVTNAIGQNVFAATYNSKHQPLTLKDGLGNTTTFTYTAWGAPYTVKTPAGVTTIYNYDGSQRLVSVSRDSAIVASFTYDTLNRVKTTTDASNITLTYNYDTLNRVSSVVYPDSTNTVYTYSSCCGLVDSVKDRSGRYSQYEYDALRRLTYVQDAAGLTTQMSYDRNGNMLQLLDSSGNKTLFAYDASNQLIKKTYANGLYEGFTYDKDSNLTARRSSAGAVTKFAYDNNDNLIQIAYPNSKAIRFVYDALNRSIGMVDDLGTSLYGYDVAGRLISEDGPWVNDKITYAYDTSGRRSQMQINGASTSTYGYDSKSRLSTLAGPGGSFAYAYAGNTDLINTLTRPNGSKTTYSYDTLNRLSQIDNKTNTSVNISRYAYTYDSRDVRTAMQQQVGTAAAQTINYGYDATDQLKTETLVESPALLNNSFAYDSMGNRTQATSATSQATYVPNPLNQYTSIATKTGATTQTTTLSYDPNGNMRSTNTGTNKSSYVYDDADRLIRYTTDIGGVKKTQTEFAYDGLSRKRIRRESTWNTTTKAWQTISETRSIYDAMNVVQERDGSNVTKVTYTRGLDMGGGIGGLLARTDTTGSYFYHYDGGGNVRQLTNSAQATVAAYTYDAFGNTLSSTGAQASQPYRFSTKEFVASCGLYDYGYRFYSPSMGRWINRDPIREKGGLNLYGFTRNSPTNFVDFLGLSVGAPGLAESLIPIWGSGRQAINDFQCGRWGWGLFNAALAITDVFLFKSLAVSGFKLLTKAGATAAGKEIMLPAGQFVNRVYNSAGEVGSQALGSSFSPGSGVLTTAAENISARGLNLPGIVNDAQQAVVYRVTESIPAVSRPAIGGTSTEYLIDKQHWSSLEKVFEFPVVP